MPLNIPLPNAPAGSFQEGFKNANQISRQLLENQIKNIERQYAPVTVPAEAASKLAYANLMGPQFLSKLMNNPSALANLSQQQRENILNKVHDAGTGVTGMNMPFMPNGMQQQNPLINMFQKLFGGGNQNPQQQVQQPERNQLINQSPVLSPADRNNLNNMQPGDSYVVQGQQPVVIPQPTAIPKKDYFEQAGTEIGKQKELEETGKNRATDIKDFGDAYQGAIAKQDTFKEINRIISSPEFEKIRQLPFADKHELLWYKRYGTKSQQNMAGRLETLIGNVVRDSAQDFKGQFRKGEQQLIEGMKLNFSDTVDSARGKAETLTYLNNMLRQRTKLAHDYMRDQHLDKTDALEQADAQIDGDAVRQQVRDQLNPRITIKNKKTGETITISPKEAREKYGVNTNV